MKHYAIYTLFLLLLTPYSLLLPPEGDSPLSAASEQRVAPAPVADDSHFVADSGGDLDQYLFRADRPNGLKFNIPITRYYFNVDNPPHFAANGLIQSADLADLILRHLLPPTTTLRLHVFDVDGTATHCPELDYLYVNQQPISAQAAPAKLSGVNGNWSTVSFALPIGLLKFPQTTGQLGQPPLPTENEIKLEIDLLCENKWAVQIAWGSLEIPSPMRPLIFAHGWTGDETTFKEFLGFAQSDRLPTAAPPDLLRGVKPIAETAPILANAITQARREFGVDKINIFAHSKGGLVARQALRSPEMAAQVDYLVTFGSPHHGSDLVPAWISCRLIGDNLQNDCRQAGDELSVAVIRDNFNYRNCQFQYLPYPQWTGCQPRFVERNRVHYVSLVGGLFDVGGRTATYPWRADTFPFPNESHDDATFSLLTHLNIHKTRQSYECAISFIAPAIYRRDGCLSAASASADELHQTPQWPDELAQISHESSGEIAANSSITLPFVLMEREVAWVNLFSDKPVTQLTLINPDGQAIQTAAAVQQNEFGEWYQVQLNQPLDGTWQWQLSANETVNYQWQVLVQSSTKLFLTTDQPDYLPNMPVVVTAALFAENSPIQGAAISLTVTRPDESQEVISMSEAVTAGLYIAQLDSSAMNGRHKLVAQAVKGLITRQAQAFFNVADKTAQIQGITGEVAQDTNDNGLFDEISYQVAVTVDAPGDYEISGMLVDKDGQPVASSSYATRQANHAPLVAGAQIISLTFPSAAMPAAGAPYTLQHVAIQREGLLIDEATNRYASQSYAASELEGETVIFVSGSDSVGAASELQISLQFTVTTAGEYQVTGRLVDESGQEIGWSQSPLQVSASGLSNVMLPFEGGLIEQHGVAGPYRLQDVTFIQQDGRASAILGQIYTTTAYSLDTFAEAINTDYISGQVLLQGRNNAAGSQVTLSVEDCAGAPDPQTAIIRLTDAAGNYQLPLSPNETYRCLRVSQANYLSASHSQATFQNGDLRPVTLLAGDVTHDGQINIFDLAYLAARYQQKEATADLNGDGLVNIFDLSLTASNYPQRGPKNW